MDFDDTLPENISSRLLRGEKVLWWGRPAQGIMFTGRDIFLVPFSLLWGGFAIFWESQALHGKAPFPFVLFGIPFVLVGLFLIFGRFLLDAWLRGHTTYVLTDSRVLVARSGPWPSFTTSRLDRLPEASLNETSGGRGTIKFGSQGFFGNNVNNGFAIWVPALQPTVQFISIDEAARVFAILQARS